MGRVLLEGQVVVGDEGGAVFWDLPHLPDQLPAVLFLLDAVGHLFGQLHDPLEDPDEVGEVLVDVGLWVAGECELPLHYIIRVIFIIMPPTIWQQPIIWQQP